MSRARKGAGTTSRRHVASCPPAVEGKRPEHDCKGTWKGQAWVTKGGIKKRVDVYGATEAIVSRKIKAVQAKEVAGTLHLGGTMKVGDWLDQWYAEGVSGDSGAKPWKRSTQKGYTSRINVWLKPHLGHHRLDQLTVQHVQSLYGAMRRQGLSETTLSMAHVCLSSALKAARRRGLVPTNVCEDLAAPKPDNEERAALTTREAERVLEVAGMNPRPWVALLCGVRQGEALALRWKDVELDAVDEEGEPAPCLWVRQSATIGDAGAQTYDTPKSGKARRVPLPAPVVFRLRAAKERQGGKPSDLVFQGPGGGPLLQNTDAYRWVALCKKAGVKRVVLHSARQTCSQLLEDMGVSDRVVADILGHAQVQMTHHYQRGNAAATTRAMQTLDEFGGGKGVGGLRAV